MLLLSWQMAAAGSSCNLAAKYCPRVSLAELAVAVAGIVSGGSVVTRSDDLLEVLGRTVLVGAPSRHRPARVEGAGSIRMLIRFPTAIIFFSEILPLGLSCVLPRHGRHLVRQHLRSRAGCRLTGVSREESDRPIPNLPQIAT